MSSIIGASSVVIYIITIQPPENKDNGSGTGDDDGSVIILYRDVIQYPEGYSKPIFQENAVFVSINGVDSPTNGNKTHPFRTINYGITKAKLSGSKDIVVGYGLYNESIKVNNGNSIRGGYSETFDAYSLKYLRANIDNLFNTPCSINASEITSETVIEGLIVHGPIMTTLKSNSYAFYIKNCNGSLIIRNCTIFGGKGADGNRGYDGSDGDDGDPGFDGMEQCDWSGSNSTTGGTGGSGGGGGLGKGGDGASFGNLTIPGFNISQPWGKDGEYGGGIGMGGIGGVGGTGGIFIDFKVVNITRYGTDGEDGSYGWPGDDGAGGLGALDANGYIVSEHWNANNDLDGGYSGHGGGCSCGIYAYKYGTPLYETKNSIILSTGEEGQGGIGGFSLGYPGEDGCDGFKAAIKYKN